MKHKIIFTLILSFLLSFFMTMWITYLNLGITPTFFNSWSHAFLLAWPAACAISFFASPLAQKITQKLIQS